MRINADGEAESFTISATGMDMKRVTQNLIAAVSDRYLGHGSNLVQTTNALDMMRTMDKDAYAEYQKMGKKMTADLVR